MDRLRLLVLSAFLLLFFPLAGQVVFSEDFEAVTVQGSVGNIPDGWTLYNDGNQPSSTFSYINQAWKVRETTGGNKKAISTSWFTNPNARADRWMITPAIELTGIAYPYLMFTAQSGDATDLDSYAVKLSVDGVEKDHFAHTLLTVPAETFAGKTYALSLEEYKNNDVHIAFILNSLYKYTLYIDDITVIDLSTPIVTLSDINAPVIITSQSAIEINAKAFVKSHTPVTSYQINYSLNDGAAVHHAVEGVNIGNMESFIFEVPPFYLEEDAYELKLWLSRINGEEGVESDVLTTRFEVTDKTYYPRKTLLEVFSSSTCGPCAGANVNIKEAYTALNANTEDTNLYVLKYQVNIPNTGDPAVTEESLFRATTYGVNSAPQGYINGQRYNETWSGLKETLPATVSNNLGNMTPFLIDAGMHREGNKYFIDVDITNTGAYDGAVLYVALLEDSIYHEPQSNGETMFYNVFRKFLPTPYGEPLTFIESGQRRISYEYTFDMIRPKIFHTLDSVSALIFLQHNATKEILQAAYIPAVKNSTAIDNPSPDISLVTISPNPCSSGCKLHLSLARNARVSIELFDLNGRKAKALLPKDYSAGNHTIDMPAEDLAPGVYMAKVDIGGEIITKKILRVNK